MLQCKVTNRYKEGDHVILIGQVLDVRNKKTDPLLFFAGGYKRLQN